MAEQFLNQMAEGAYEKAMIMAREERKKAIAVAREAYEEAWMAMARKAFDEATGGN